MAVIMVYKISSHDFTSHVCMSSACIRIRILNVIHKVGPTTVAFVLSLWNCITSQAYFDSSEMHLIPTKITSCLIGLNFIIGHSFGKADESLVW